MGFERGDEISWFCLHQPTSLDAVWCSRLSPRLGQDRCLVVSLGTHSLENSVVQICGRLLCTREASALTRPCEWALHICLVARRLCLMDHALQCFVRLIRAVLGHSSIADKKVEFGMKLVILGVEVPTLLATPGLLATSRCR